VERVVVERVGKVVVVAEAVVVAAVKAGATGQMRVVTTTETLGARPAVGPRATVVTPMPAPTRATRLETQAVRTEAPTRASTATMAAAVPASRAAKPTTAPRAATTHRVVQTKRPIPERATKILEQTQVVAVAAEVEVAAEAVAVVVAEAVVAEAVVVVVVEVAAEAVAGEAVAVVVAPNLPIVQPTWVQEAVRRRQPRVNGLALSPCSQPAPLPPSIRANVP